MKTILVVDDDDAVRGALCDLIALLYERDLAAGSIEVMQATSGEEAVAVAARLAISPALVIMDLHLPGIDGVEAHSRMTAARGAPVRALFLTGYAGSGPLQQRLAEALAGGAGTLVAKPISATILAENIDRALQRPDGAATEP